MIQKHCDFKYNEKSNCAYPSPIVHLKAFWMVIFVVGKDISVSVNRLVKHLQEVHEKNFIQRIEC